MNMNNLPCKQLHNNICEVLNHIMFNKILSDPVHVYCNIKYKSLWDLFVQMNFEYNVSSQHFEVVVIIIIIIIILNNTFIRKYNLQQWVQFIFIQYIYNSWKHFFNLCNSQLPVQRLLCCNHLVLCRRRPTNSSSSTACLSIIKVYLVASLASVLSTFRAFSSKTYQSGSRRGKQQRCKDIKNSY